MGFLSAWAGFDAVVAADRLSRVCAWRPPQSDFRLMLAQDMHGVNRRNRRMPTLASDLPPLAIFVDPLATAAVERACLH